MPEHAQHISCQEVVELVTDYLDRALPVEQTSLFEQHINFCDGCDWYLDQMRTTIVAVGQVREADVPLEVRDKLVRAFRDWRGS
jgi:anti-sigma factor RsiW